MRIAEKSEWTTREKGEFLMKHKTRTKTLSWLLSITLMLSLVPGMGLTAYAATDTYTGLMNSKTVVKFNNHDWYIIADDSTASGGTVTLLAADTSFGKSKFRDSGNAYSNSTVKGVLDALTEDGGAFADVKDAIVDTDLTDVNVTGAKLYLLSTSEAGPYKSFYFTGEENGSWWLRSPGGGTNYAAYASGRSSTVDYGGTKVTKSLGVRPALKLNLSSVIFSSVNLSGGANASASGGTVKQNYFDYGSTRNAMTSVTYTASEDYMFPATSDYYTTTNGITVTRTNDTVVTVSGTPTDVANVTVPDAVLAHTHSFTYSASGATITATCANTDQKCPLPDDGNGNHTATLTIKPPANLVYDGKAKAATVEGEIPDVTTPDIMYEGRNGTTYVESTAAPTEKGDYTASVTLGEKTAGVDFTIKDASYTIIIPAKLTVENAGWNATAGITASGEIAEGTKLTVTAASANEWKLKDGENTVDYYLATEEGGEPATVWDFTVDELAAENGTNKSMGAVVEEYINKPAGDYTDTVTFTASVGNRLSTITISGTELTYADGDTWAQIVERNPGKIYIAGSQNNLIWRAQDNPLYIGGSPVRPSDTIDPRASYQFVAG